MNRKLLTRLIFDFIAAGLLLVALAYEWLSNAVHELVGTPMFVLLIVHSILNRRWYGTTTKGRRETRRTITTAINLGLVIAMLGLLVTSVMISRVVFAFLSLDGGFMARQIHTLAAYWGLIFVGVHLGMHWTMIISATRATLRNAARSAIRSKLLRILASAIAIFGVYSYFEMNIGSKLVLYFTSAYWDFAEPTLGFFARYSSIVGLHAFLVHYLMQWLQKRRRNSRKPDFRRAA